jgi:hypothetical protein
MVVRNPRSGQLEMANEVEPFYWIRLSRLFENLVYIFCIFFFTKQLRLN